MLHAGGSWPKQRASAAFEYAVKQWAAVTPKQRIWAVVKDQNVAGLVSAQWCSEGNDICELGVLVRTPYHGQGIARQALNGLIRRWAHHTPDEPKPKAWLARVRPTNSAASRLFDSLGFEVMALKWTAETGPFKLMYFRPALGSFPRRLS